MLEKSRTISSQELQRQSTKDFKISRGAKRSLETLVKGETDCFTNGSIPYSYSTVFCRFCMVDHLGPLG